LKIEHYSQVECSTLNAHFKNENGREMIFNRSKLRQELPVYRIAIDPEAGSAGASY
jgi:hypothetical protein